MAQHSISSAQSNLKSINQPSSKINRSLSSHYQKILMPMPSPRIPLPMPPHLLILVVHFISLSSGCPGCPDHRLFIYMSLCLFVFLSNKSILVKNKLQRIILPPKYNLPMASCRPFRSGTGELDPSTLKRYLHNSEKRNKCNKSV